MVNYVIDLMLYFLIDMVDVRRSWNIFHKIYSNSYLFHLILMVERMLLMKNIK